MVSYNTIFFKSKFLHNITINFMKYRFVNIDRVCYNILGKVIIINGVDFGECKIQINIGRTRK